MMEPQATNVSNAKEANPAETDSDGSNEGVTPKETDEEVDEETTKRASMRESIRARLRAQERRLGSLVRSASGDGIETVFGQMKSVQANLEQVAAEKSELENELSRLKNATDGDEFLKEKMAGIQEGFDKQVETIRSLQEEVSQKNDEIDRLRVELVKKLQRIVELEFDLETHEIHYTTYAKEQFKLGEDALAEIKMKDDGHDSFSSSSHSSGKPLTPRRAQKLISKLLSDLDSLEIRYKEEKVMAASSLEKARLESEDLRTQVQVLKGHLCESSEHSDSDDGGADVFDKHNLAQLKKKLDTSEAKTVMYRKEIRKLKTELDQVKQSAEEDENRAVIESEKFGAEKEALQARIVQLESKPKGGGGLRRKSKKDDTKGNEAFEKVEKRIVENYEAQCRLQTAVEIKDKQISTLKKEVANLRMKDISDGNTKDSLYTEFDTTLLRTSQARSNRPFSSSVRATPSNGDDTEYAAELKRQLQEAQQQLVKKDQELVIERAKAASTAAGLLARITELTGKKVDTSQKNVPHRFYL